MAKQFISASVFVNFNRCEKCNNKKRKIQQKTNITGFQKQKCAVKPGIMQIAVGFKKGVLHIVKAEVSALPSPIPNNFSGMVVKKVREMVGIAVKRLKSSVDA